MHTRSKLTGSVLTLVAGGLVAACSGGVQKDAAGPRVPVAVAAASVVAPRVPLATARPFAQREGGAIALGTIDGRAVLYVADEDEHLVRLIDVEREEELGVTPLDGRPGQLLVLGDGTVAVAMRDHARVDVLGPSASASEPLVVRASVDVSAEPIGLGLAPDDRTLFVASGWGHAVTRIDLADAPKLSVTWFREIAREPRAVAVSDDGTHAFITHAAGGRLTVLDLRSDIKVIDRPMMGSEETVNEGHRMMADTPEETTLGGRVIEQGFALAKTHSLAGSPFDGRVLMPHVMAFAGDPEVASEGYGGGGTRLDAEVFNVAVLDGASGDALARSLVLSSDADLELPVKRAPQRRCLLPRAAATLGRELFVACLGIDSIVAYDAASLRPRSAERRRFRVAEGPTGIVVDEATSQAYVWSQFARAVSVVDLKSPSAPDVRSFWLAHHRAAKVDDPEIALGRRLFHAVGDARVAHDGRACASCHPDGRDDGLVWSTPNGPRQTPILAGRTLGTAPYSWLGDATSVSQHLEHTVKRLGGKGLPPDDREALAKYLAVMPTPVAALPSTDDRARAARGAAIFASAEAGCASCHGAKGDDPDGLPHDVKSKAAGDKRAAFDTPSLRYLAGSAPYFHDGRYRDLRTLLRETDGKMGSTKHLSDDDRDALQTFLETL